jgi:hypothetical protein
VAELLHAALAFVEVVAHCLTYDEGPIEQRLRPRSSVQEVSILPLPFYHLPLAGVKVKEMPHSVHQSPLPESLQYWQVNVLPGQRTKQCPEYLLGQSEKNQRILLTPDEDYCRQTWPEVQEIVSQWHRPLTNNLISRT